MSEPIIVNITLGKDLQEDWESYQECCISLSRDFSINKFLYYVDLFGTYERPKNPE